MTHGFNLRNSGVDGGILIQNSNFSNLTLQIWCPLFFKIQINSLTLSRLHFLWKSINKTRKNYKINKMFQLYVGPCLHCFVVLWQKRRARANYFVLIWYRQLLTQHSHEIITKPCSRSFRHWDSKSVVLARESGKASNDDYEALPNESGLI